ncbi:MAG: RAMP superfamily CRISPR-associated protein [Candidatus Bathyarchaeia archaeon]
MEIVCNLLTGVITAETPLHIGSGTHFGIIKQTRDYIPGSVMRGATGATLIKMICVKPENVNKHKECPLRTECLYFQLYQDEENKASNIIFRNAYPRHQGCANKGTYIPTPKTLFICKNKKCEERYNTYNPPPKCTKCGEDIKPFDGFICASCQTITPFPMDIQRITRTAINRMYNSAAVIQPIPGEEAYGTLHTKDVVPKDINYTLQIIVHPEAEPHIKTLVDILEKALPDEGIGGSKSRGLGKVSVKIEKIEKISVEDLDKRVQQITPEDFSLRLISDAVIEKPIIPPETLLAAARRAYTWAYHAGAPALPDLQLKKWRVTTGTFSGWSLKGNRRRDIEPTVVAGSVFHYTSQGGEQLARSLAALEYLAIGKWKPLGLGQVKIENIP